MLANRLQQEKRPLHVRAQERLGVGDGAVVVGLGCAVHDGVALRDKPVEKPVVADVAHDELDPARGQPGDVLPPPRVGQLVQSRSRVPGKTICAVAELRKAASPNHCSKRSKATALELLELLEQTTQSIHWGSE